MVTVTFSVTKLDFAILIPTIAVDKVGKEIAIKIAFCRRSLDIEICKK